MLALWIIAAAIAVVAIAFGTIGRLSATLATTESTAVYDLQEATDWVADRLPTALASRLSHDDVKAVLLWHLSFLRTQGFATFGRVDEVAMEAAFGGDDVVAHEDEAVDAVLAMAAESEREIEPVDVVVIVERGTEYLEAIGALGVRAPLTPPDAT